MTVERCCVFDCAWLRSRMGFHASGQRHGVSTWTRWPGGLTAAAIDWETDLRDPAAACLWLRYAANGVPVDERVALEATRPRYGGVRWWFRCPHCARRCAKQYLPPARARFRCRRCYRLSYESQRETPPYRLLRRAHALWRCAGADIGRSPRLPHRPKWMRRRTHERLVAEARRLDAESLLAMFASLKRDR